MPAAPASTATAGKPHVERGASFTLLLPAGAAVAPSAT
jgi:hypothetical protein